MKRLLVSLVETKFETHLLEFLSLSQKNIYKVLLFSILYIFF